MTEESKENLGMKIIHNHDTLSKQIKRRLRNKRIILSIISIMVLIAFYSLVGYYKFYLLSNIYLIIILITSLISVPLLTVFIITIKESFESENRKEELGYAFIDELFRNFTNLTMNGATIHYELSLLKENRILYSQLYKIQLDMYNLLKQIFPEQITNIGYSNLENYIGSSHAINKLISDRDYIGIHRHLDDKSFIEILENIDKLLLENIEIQFNNIFSLLLTKSKFESKVKLLEADHDKIKWLTEKKNYLEFLRFYGVDGNSVSIEEFKEIYEQNITKLLVVILDK